MELTPFEKSHALLQDISSITQDVSMYINLALELTQLAKMREYEETKRLDIQKESESKIETLTQQMNLLEKTITNDNERYEQFMTNAWNLINKLIEQGQADLPIVTILVERMAEGLNGQVETLLNARNQQASAGMLSLRVQEID